MGYIGLFSTCWDLNDDNFSGLRRFRKGTTSGCRGRCWNEVKSPGRDSKWIKDYFCLTDWGQLKIGSMKSPRPHLSESPLIDLRHSIASVACAVVLIYGMSLSKASRMRSRSWLEQYLCSMNIEQWENSRITNPMRNHSRKNLRPLIKWVIWFENWKRQGCKIVTPVKNCDFFLQ